MSRLFTIATNDYLQNNNAVAIAPLTMSCWIYVVTINTQMVIMSVGASAADTEYHVLQIRGDAAYQIQATTAAGGSVDSATTSTGRTYGEWIHAVGVWSATNARAAYINGGSAGTNATSLNPGGLDRTAIGRLVRATPVLYFGGYIQEAAIWSAALDAGEILALAKGYSPALIRPGALAGYWPIAGNASPEPDRWKNRYDMTLGGSPSKGDHRPMIYPVGHQIGQAGA